MRLVRPLHFTSLEELKLNLDLVKNEFISSSIVCVRGLKITKEEQLELVKNLGDIFFWTPNSSSSFNHQYTESHTGNISIPNSTGEQVILGWHMEHIDYDNYTPLVAGVWNMEKFICSSDTGMTYFMDSREIYKKIYTEEEKIFLEKCVTIWTQNYSDNRIFTNTANLVANHWLTEEKQIRLEMHYMPTLKLYTYNENPPTAAEEELFKALVDRFISTVYENEDLRIVHKWEEGDVLIPDLHCLVHAVTGGFTPDQREFTGYWCYLNSPENLESDKLHPSWA